MNILLVAPIILRIVDDKVLKHQAVVKTTKNVEIPDRKTYKKVLSSKYCVLFNKKKIYNKSFEYENVINNSLIKNSIK